MRSSSIILVNDTNQATAQYEPLFHSVLSGNIFLLNPSKAFKVQLVGLGKIRFDRIILGKFVAGHISRTDMGRIIGTRRDEWPMPSQLGKMLQKV